jgi:Ca2+-transporting ATPase
MAASAQNESMWYRMTPMQVAQEFDVDPVQGLSTVKASARLKKYGPNILGTEKKRPCPVVRSSFYRHAILSVLLAAAFLSLLLFDELGLSLLLAGLAIFGMLIGIYPQVKAETDIASLEKRVRVRRDGQIIEINAAGVAPGDIVILTIGDHVPADGRLYIAARFGIDESTLTGVSTPAWKGTAAIEKAQPWLGERINMVFMNTTVTHGYGVMIVTSTGMSTEMGQIMGRLNPTEMDKKLPQKQPVSEIVFSTVMALAICERS